MTKPLRKNENGLVAIVVTLFIMLVISLVVIAFARLTRREQRQSLDRQLSTQAFYAAETGINDALQAIKDGTITGEKNDCAPLPAPYNNVLDAAGDITYSCLLVDPTPTSLEFSSIGGDSKVVPIELESGGPVNSITIFWQDQDGDSGAGLASCPALGAFPATWPALCQTGILRVDIVPGVGISQAVLENQTYTGFFQPRTGAAITSTYGAATIGPNQGVNQRGSCVAGQTPKLCKITINGLGATKYFLRMRSIYRDSAVTICAQSLVCDSSAQELKGAQAVVDSTGKANDVLKRLQVRISTASLVNIPGITATAPDFGIYSSQTVCKNFIVITGENATRIDPDTACAVN